MRRREFLQAVAQSAGFCFLTRRNEAMAKEQLRPNFLWISCEDMSPNLGCFGDPYAVTPNLDRLAAEGVRYVNVFTHSPVCAPSRSGIITGMYSTTIGTHQMRCKGVPPPEVKCFPEYLRAAGYYCTNNVKTDYQFDPPLTAWDECSQKAHWRNRPSGQPFFAVFNFTVTHESQVRSREPGLLKRIEALAPHERHDPAKAILPPYYPDTPIVRRDWAQYYDVITLMDKQAGEILRQLEEDGLAEDTIVWFWSDHGRGLPRGKRWVYDSGIHVPLILRIPEKFRAWASPDNPDAVRPGSVNEDLIAFVDFAPTMLSLAGLPIPQHMQGRPFLGPQKAPPRRFVFAHRDRMDETYDLIRAVRDKRFKYIRNFMFYLPHSQEVSYMEETPTTQEMRRLHAEGKLTAPQELFFQCPKPIEELYDTQNDPHEVHNLAGDPRYRDVLERMRTELLRWMRETGDVGLIPEPEFEEMKRPGGQWEQTASPSMRLAAREGEEVVIALECATPGASIAYRVDEGRWLLYTQPVRLRRGQRLQAKANRIGFRDSQEVVYVAGEELPPPPSPPQHRPHWREVLDRSDLLERLLAIKEWDGKGKEAIPHYLKALDDPYGPVRYWAIVGLQVSCREAEEIDQVKEEVRRRLRDASPVVRVAAAEALGSWGEVEEALPTLVELLHHPQEMVRLYAINALKRLDAKARPALPHLRAALKDSSGYVQRVARTTLRQWGEESE